VSEGHVAFVGSVPENYDRYLGPLLFQPFADDLAGRLPVRPGLRVLEVACGTGRVTRRLLERLAGTGTIVATDLNEAMMACGKSQLGERPGLQWRQADATALPFEDRAFDAVVCQFGLMFFPDKAAALREAFRVLAPGGVYLFNVWGAMSTNPLQRITHETAVRFFPADPPRFYEVPCSLHEPAPLQVLLAAAGFTGVEIVHLDKTGTSPSTDEAAVGLLDGNPIAAAIVERRAEALPEVRRAVAERIAAELGDRPVRAPLRAVVLSARRP
jgi:SAM-dependent methyltransferase